MQERMRFEDKQSEFDSKKPSCHLPVNTSSKADALLKYCCKKYTGKVDTVRRDA